MSLKYEPFAADAEASAASGSRAAEKAEQARAEIEALRAEVARGGAREEARMREVGGCRGEVALLQGHITRLEETARQEGVARQEREDEVALLQGHTTRLEEAHVARMAETEVEIEALRVEVARGGADAEVHREEAEECRDRERENGTERDVCEQEREALREEAVELAGRVLLLSESNVALLAHPLNPKP